MRPSTGGVSAWALVDESSDQRAACLIGHFGTPNQVSDSGERVDGVTGSQGGVSGYSITPVRGHVELYRGSRLCASWEYSDFPLDWRRAMWRSGGVYLEVPTYRSGMGRDRYKIRVRRAPFCREWVGLRYRPGHAGYIGPAADYVAQVFDDSSSVLASLVEWDKMLRPMYDRLRDHDESAHQAGVADCVLAAYPDNWAVVRQVWWCLEQATHMLGLASCRDIRLLQWIQKTDASVRKFCQLLMDVGDRGARRVLMAQQDCIITDGPILLAAKSWLERGVNPMSVSADIASSVGLSIEEVAACIRVWLYNIDRRLDLAYGPIQLVYIGSSTTSTMLPWVVLGWPVWKRWPDRWMIAVPQSWAQIIVAQAPVGTKVVGAPGCDTSSDQIDNDWSSSRGLGSLSVSGVR